MVGAEQFVSAYGWSFRNGVKLSIASEIKDYRMDIGGCPPSDIRNSQ